MPGHRYTGPGNPLDKQLKYNPNTGQILKIYEEPTGRTDAVSMQHDVDYSVCGNNPKSDQIKCKNEADRKMVKALDSIPWKERQWGHTVARNAIAAKAKLQWRPKVLGTLLENTSYFQNILQKTTFCQFKRI